MRTIAALLVLVALAAAASASPAHTKKAKKTKRRAPPAPLVYKVQPSEEIETRIQQESTKALDILSRLETADLFASPYLIASVYYHDGFLSDFPEDKVDADPASRIGSRIEKELTPALKQAYVARLLQYWCANYPRADAPVPALIVPVPYEPPAAPAKPTRWSKRRRWRPRTNHETALDLFTDEGTPVRSASRGVVVLADASWNPAEPFSTTSQKGGNAVIIFDPDNERFFRYAHLETVLTRPGSFVEAGEQIGTVGHTGLNASRPMHGRHVHFEINQVDEGGRVRALRTGELWVTLRGQSAGGAGAGK